MPLALITVSTPGISPFPAYLHTTSFIPFQPECGRQRIKERKQALAELIRLVTVHHAHAFAGQHTGMGGHSGTCSDHRLHAPQASCTIYDIYIMHHAESFREWHPITHPQEMSLGRTVMN